MPDQSTQTNKRMQLIRPAPENLLCKAVHTGFGFHVWPDRLNVSWSSSPGSSNRRQCSKCPWLILLNETGMQNSHEEPQEFLKTAGRQHRRWEDTAESIPVSIPQFHSRSRTVMRDWTPDALALTTCSFGMSPLQVPASQFFPPEASSPCFARFPENTCEHLCLKQLLLKKTSWGHTDSPQCCIFACSGCLNKGPQTEHLKV